jgi:hypothetical protein
MITRHTTALEDETNMEVRPVDSRTGGWELYAPTYRMYFWERGWGSGDVPRQNVAFASDEYELSGAHDVLEVIAWASRNSGARRGVVYPESDRSSRSAPSSSTATTRASFISRASTRLATHSSR